MTWVELGYGAVVLLKQRQQASGQTSCSAGATVAGRAGFFSLGRMRQHDLWWWGDYYHVE